MPIKLSDFSVNDQDLLNKKKQLAQNNNKNKKTSYIPVSELVVRKGFSMPACDIEKLEQLRLQYAQIGAFLNKSEVLRLGIYALEQSSLKQKKSVLDKLERLSVGRRPVNQAK